MLPFYLILNRWEKNVDDPVNLLLFTYYYFLHISIEQLCVFYISNKYIIDIIIVITNNIYYIHIYLSVPASFYFYFFVFFSLSLHHHWLQHSVLVKTPPIMLSSPHTNIKKKYPVYYILNFTLKQSPKSYISVLMRTCVADIISLKNKTLYVL